MSEKQQQRKWRRVDGMREGIIGAAGIFLDRAKNASEKARRYLAEYRDPNKHPFSDCHTRYLAARSERSNWVHAARIILSQTQEGLEIADLGTRNYLARLHRKEAA